MPKGTTIIEAAKQAGVLVPHYCYHPSLPSPAVCRMCLVEVEKAPKLMPACVTTVAEGQVVHVNSEQAKKAREGVLEFLLINHPLDCPICDQAGECELQDYVFQEGRAGTRYSEYAKRYNPVEDFGPDVLYVPNRCILCTRCVRFMEDVAETPVLNVSERGDRAYIGIDRGAAARSSVGRQRGGPLPGGLAPLEGLPAQGAGLGPRQDGERLPRLHPGLQHQHRHPRRRGGAAPAAAQPRREPPLHLRHGRHGLPLDEPGRPDRGAAGARGQRAWSRPTGTRRSTGWATCCRGAPARWCCWPRAARRTESLGLVRRLVAGRDVTAAVSVPMGDEAPLAGIPNLALRRERAPNLERRASSLGYWRGTGARRSRRSGRRGAGDRARCRALARGRERRSRRRAARWCGWAPWRAMRTDKAQLVLPVTDDGGGERHLREPRRPGAALSSRRRRAPGMARPAWWVAGEVLAGPGPDSDAPATGGRGVRAAGARRARRSPG